MAEVSRLINQHDDRVNLIKMLKDRTSLIRELGDGGKETVTDLKNQLKILLEQLRFPDGSTLKEMLTQKQLQKEFQKKLNEGGDDQNDEEDDDEAQKEFLDNLDNLERDSGQQDDDEYEESEQQSSDGQSLLAEEIARGMLEASKLEESEDEEDHHSPSKSKGDVNQREMEIERQLKIKREQSKRKNEFKDKICDLVDDEQQRDNIIEGFDKKMRSLDDLLQSEMDRQNDALKAKRAARRNRKNEALAVINEKVSFK